MYILHVQITGIKSKNGELSSAMGLNYKSRSLNGERQLMHSRCTFHYSIVDMIHNTNPSICQLNGGLVKRFVPVSLMVA